MGKKYTRTCKYHARIKKIKKNNLGHHNTRDVSAVDFMKKNPGS